MIDEIKDETNKQWNESITKIIREIKSIRNKKLNEFRKPTKDIKDYYPSVKY